MELTLTELQEMATRQQQQIEAQQQMLVAKVTFCFHYPASNRSFEEIVRGFCSAFI